MRLPCKTGFYGLSPWVAEDRMAHNLCFQLLHQESLSSCISESARIVWGRLLYASKSAKQEAVADEAVMSSI